MNISEIDNIDPDDRDRAGPRNFVFKSSVACLIAQEDFQCMLLLLSKHSIYSDP
jgi:hypothetical protein